MKSSKKILDQYNLQQHTQIQSNIFEMHSNKCEILYVFSETEF